MDMTPERWRNTSTYLQQVFGQEDAQQAGMMARAVAAGLPEIAISSEVGKLLYILTRMAGGGGGARLAIELGTLAGYSGIWLARGLAAGGMLVTVELDEKHAAFAQREFERAGVADRVRLERGAALEVLPRLAREFGPASVDLAFLDAVKVEYMEYASLLKPMLRRGALLLADNVLGSDFWIDDPPGSSATRDAIDRFNRAMAADEDFDVVAVPIRQGVMIARRK